MFILKRLFKLIGFALQTVESLVNDITDLLALLIKQPFRDLSAARRKKGGFNFKSLLLIPFQLLLSLISVIGRIVLSPAEFLVGVFKKKPAELLWTVPWLLGFVVLAGVLFSGIFNHEARLAAIRKQAVEAFDKGNFKASSQHYARLIRQSESAEQEDLFKYHIALGNAGNRKEAAKVLQEIAPGQGSPGYAPAHEYVAIGIARNMKRPPDPLTLRTLKWHLDHAPELKTPEINRCWAEYYLNVKDPESALRHMKAAAEIKPEYMVMVADIYNGLGNQPLRIDALEQAEKQYRAMVEKEPLLHKNRIMLARIQKDLGRIDTAERTLLAGVDLKNNAEIRSACCGFYLILFSETETGDLQKKFELLSRSLEFDPNYPPTYEALINFYRTMESNAPQKKKTIEMLESWVQGESTTALAHFALGNILWTENRFDESQELMEKAFKMDANFAIIANNLAWLLAHSHQPDLPRAVDLARQASDAQPKDGRIRDTLATILMKQKNYDEALAEFQLALQRPSLDKASRQLVHQKMANSYRALGKTELALQHDKQAALFKSKK